MAKYSYTKETEQKALDLFDSGSTIKSIGESLSLTKSTARLLIKRNGKVPISKALQSQRVKFNPFNLNSEQSYYWLGYLIADGWVTKNRNSVGIDTMTDPEHLFKIANLIPNINFYTTETKTGTRYSLAFHHRETKEYLLDIGITSTKSKHLYLKIPLNNHILRGIFDGDGCISIGCPKITLGSLTFSKQIQEYLIEHNIDSLCYIKDKKSFTPCYDLRLKGDNRLLFYELLYSNAAIFMKRKKDKYRSALKKFKVKNIGLIAGSLPLVTKVISSQD